MQRASNEDLVVAIAREVGCFEDAGLYAWTEERLVPPRQCLPKCSAGAFVPFADGKWGAGVFGEAKFLKDRGCPIFQFGGLRFGATRISIRTMKKNLLSIEETRERIRTPDGKSIPYLPGPNYEQHVL